MVSRFAKLARRFVDDRDGITLVETMIVMPIVITVLMAMVELGTAMFQWNQSVKAVQIGARLAAVSSPIASSTAMATLVTDEATIDVGDPVPDAFATVSCGGSGTPCESTAIARLLTGGDSNCGGATLTPPVGICDVNPQITADNIRVTYTRTRLGYVGRPFGPVLSVTVELVDFNFNFLFIDDLIPGFLDQIAIPAHPVTFTSEDLSDCKEYGCP